jgi:hypothetical protein
MTFNASVATMPGADADVEHFSARRQPGAHERLAPVPASRAEGQHIFDTFVVGCGVVENLLEKGAVFDFVLVVAMQWRVGSEGRGASTCVGGRWRHRLIMLKSA